MAKKSPHSTYVSLTVDKVSKGLHVWIAEAVLQRALYEGEIADHVDNDQSNNSIFNLQILSTADNNRREHSKFVTLMKDGMGTIFSSVKRAATVFEKPQSTMSDCIRDGVCGEYKAWYSTKQEIVFFFAQIAKINTNVDQWIPGISLEPCKISINKMHEWDFKLDFKIQNKDADRASYERL